MIQAENIILVMEWMWSGAHGSTHERTWVRSYTQTQDGISESPISSVSDNRLKNDVIL